MKKLVYRLEWYWLLVFNDTIPQYDIVTRQWHCTCPQRSQGGPLCVTRAVTQHPTLSGVGSGEGGGGGGGCVILLQVLSTDSHLSWGGCVTSPIGGSLSFSYKSSALTPSSTKRRLCQSIKSSAPEYQGRPTDLQTSQTVFNLTSKKHLLGHILRDRTP